VDIASGSLPSLPLRFVQRLNDRVGKRSATYGSERACNNPSDQSKRTTPNEALEQRPQGCDNLFAIPNVSALLAEAGQLLCVALFQVTEECLADLFRKEQI
jgi:hypothetical protein